MYQLTYYTTDLKSIKEAQDRIEIDYKNVTEIKTKDMTPDQKLYAIFLTNHYWEYCRNYVSKKCKVKI